MPRCHYITDKEVGKVLIPGCYGTAHHYDIAYCTCPKPDRKTEIENLKSKIERLEKRIELLEGRLK